mmetsp:Transcript_23177/g.64361  ORF Transcript_23177/g.64361 Transcript_23177/m.64361 type:complete len:275 (+) Transcript_23177:85-909(+)|eukprot:CAMPEP_0117693264 /NCGR_PEP_ID=MMETSP0804-20121206/26787_1 /TAXON_ID=1074897 /ORGANISM="Tetraselmis astigmatica, Strain CCMP880" /LENGTH=274 /DNA_ID=CAMNT_0005506805 /DNA_START=19 /DNA_END=843 /DNA_ORIENTATION=+
MVAVAQLARSSPTTRCLAVPAGHKLSLAGEPHGCLSPVLGTRGPRRQSNGVIMASAAAEGSSGIRVILGSSSKWRAQLVGRAIPDGFVLVPGGVAPDIDEKALGDRSHGALAKELVSRIAQAKADALIPKLRAEDPPVADVLITADQVIVFDGTVREKPVDKDQALEYLQSYGLTGHPAECVTGVVVSCVSSGKRFSGVDVAWQYFHQLPDDVANAVIAKGEVMHCAGSFMVDEPMLHPFLAERKGEVESVEGMPIALTTELLLKAASFLQSTN